MKPYQVIEKFFPFSWNSQWNSRDEKWTLSIYVFVILIIFHRESIKNFDDIISHLLGIQKFFNRPKQNDCFETKLSYYIIFMKIMNDIFVFYFSKNEYNMYGCIQYVWYHILYIYNDQKQSIAYLWNDQKK